MKKVAIGSLLLSLSFSSQLPAVELDTEEQRLSYSLGLMLGSRLKEDVGTLDLEALKAGIKSVYDDAEPALSSDEVNDVMAKFQQQRVDKQQQEMAAVSQTNLEQGQAFLTEKATEEGVKTTPSGLHYKIITEGSGESPTAADQVKVHYRGTLIDGTEFDSSYGRGEPIVFPLGNVIPGWTEGLQLVKEGGKAELYIPANLAYGASGTGPIGPNSTLIFEVELLDINPEN